MEQFHLLDEKDAILELTKGKLTTDPQRHTGEGIFFTSRMFDKFSMSANGYVLVHTQEPDNWKIELSDVTNGTVFEMLIALNSQRTTHEVFDRFTNHDDLRFEITQVPVALAQFGDDNLISRSQAKRILANLTKFRRVILDFQGVSSIGPAFSDEIFRVFCNEHPEIGISYVNASELVEKMISRAVAARKT